MNEAATLCCLLLKRAKRQFVIRERGRKNFNSDKRRTRSRLTKMPVDRLVNYAHATVRDALL